jgi:hypothetical protein
MIEEYTEVKEKFGRPAVRLEGTWFFVAELVGTKGTFKAHPQDQFAYMTETKELAINRNY